VEGGRGLCVGVGRAGPRRLRLLQAHHVVGAPLEQGALLVALKRLCERVGEVHEVHLELLEDREDHALLLEDECNEKVERRHVILPALDRKLMRAFNRVAGLVGEVVKCGRHS
jgi:hypothetical protein